MKIKRWFLVIFVTLFSFFSLYTSNAEVNIETPAWQKVKTLGKEGSYTFRQ